jgi:hypothetical protein
MMKWKQISPSIIWICVLSALLFSAARAVQAQVVTRDDAGIPMRVISIALDPGRTYQFRTDYTLTAIPGVGTGPDSVLSLRNGVRSTDRTVAGADGCPTAPGGATERPSCFSYLVPGSAGSASVTHYLFLRAWRGYTPGQTQLWMRRDTGPEVRIGTGPVSFGGSTYVRSEVSNARLLLRTAQLPGGNRTHALWSSSDEYKVLRNDAAPELIGGTVTIDVPDRAAANLSGVRQFSFGTVLSSQAGPSRLLENTYYQAGKDVDGDGLSIDIERALRTCDRADQINVTVTGSSFRCDSLPGCSAPTSALCLASLRDTDHDGLRDDLEVFGTSPNLLAMPRFGADPAHMDVFVELDTYDQNPTLDGCQSWTAANVKQLGGDTSPSANFFADVDAIYGQAPSRLNPDGRPGINIHYDVGIANPDLRDTRWGNFGGGGTCLPNSCGYPWPWEGGHAECPAGAFSDRRRFAFIYGVDGVGPGGQTAANSFIAGHASHHVHELAHVGKLGHAGPLGSTGEHGHDNPNFRPNYPSRMNYLFQDVGNTTAVDKVAWRSLSFSDGSWNERALTNNAVSEICPLPSANLGKLTPSLGVLTEQVSGCWNVDWNRNGVIDTGSTYMRDAFIFGFRHHRWSQLNPELPVRSAPAAAVVNGVLLFALPVEITSGLPTLTLRADSNVDCNARPLPISTPMIDEFVTGGSYPGCIRPGSPVSWGARADAVSLTAARLTVGSTVDGAIVVWADGSVLRWGRLNVSPAAVASEMAWNFVPMGTIPDAVVSQVNGSREPALARLPGTNTVLLMYRNAAGALRQRTLLQGSSAWTSDQPALRADGTPVPAQAAVTLVEHESNLLMAVNAGEFVAGVTRQRLEVYMLSNPSFRWRLDSVPYDRPTKLRPSIASTRSIEDRTRRDLYIHFLIEGGWIDFVRTKGSRTIWTYEGYMPGAQKTASGPATVYDERQFDKRGLRVLRHLPSRTCTTNAECAGLAGAPFCNVSRGFCSDRSDGDPFAVLRYEPFADGPEPGSYIDYDDWTGLKWGFCRALQEQSSFAPTVAEPYSPRPFGSGVDCGPLPVYREP